MSLRVVWIEHFKLIKHFHQDSSVEHSSVLEQTGLCSVLAESAPLTQVSLSVMLNNQTNIGTWNAQVSLLHKDQHRKAR